MTAKAIVNPLLVVLNTFIEFIFKPFVRRHRPSTPLQEVETFPQFENDNHELVKELADREIPVAEIADEPESFPVFLSTGEHSPAIRAPYGVALRKSVQFRAHAGNYCSAKVIGWEADGSLLLSRKNGPPFRRRLAVN